MSLFSLMGGADSVCDHVAEFAARIHFVHFRDVVGTKDQYTEVFHDQGDTDHVAVMRAFYRAGLKCPIRPDHVPTAKLDSHESQLSSEALLDLLLGCPEEREDLQAAMGVGASYGRGGWA